jgi:hypothetical protein
VHRRRPPQSKAQQLLGMLSGAMPSRGSSSGSGRSMSKGGIAALGAGALAAFSQRDKLRGMLGGRGDAHEAGHGHDDPPTSGEARP